MIPIPLQIWLFWSAVLLSTTTHAADWHVVTHTVSHHLTERAVGGALVRWDSVTVRLAPRVISLELSWPL